MPRVVLIQNVGLVGVGRRSNAARALPRPVPPGDRGDGRSAAPSPSSCSLSAAESFAIEYWPLELYKLSLAPPPGELQGKVALVTGAAGGIGRAVLERSVQPARASSPSTSTARAPAAPSRALGDAGRRGRPAM